MPKKDFNIIVIGGGSAGLVSAYIGSVVKAKVALIKKHQMGGDCLNTGCVSSKALLRTGKILSYIKRSQDFGLKSAQVDFDFPDVMERVHNVIQKVATYGIDDLDRAIADSEDKGYVKVLTPPGKDKILGVTIVGYHAGDLITEYVLAMKHGLGLNKILGTIHIYPTMAEANKYAAGI